MKEEKRSAMAAVILSVFLLIGTSMAGSEGPRASLLTNSDRQVGPCRERYLKIHCVPQMY